MSKKTLEKLKTAAETISRELQVLGYPPVKQADLLHVLSKSVGFKSWNALRAVATRRPRKATVERLKYPAHYAAARYQALGLSVDLVLWEDPKEDFGYGYYAYNAHTGQCLIPRKDRLFGSKDVPTYDEVVNLIEELETSWRVCEKCGHRCEEEDLGIRPICPETSCGGTVHPILRAL